MRELEQYIRNVMKQEGDLKEFSYKGYDCLIVRMKGLNHLCGYVRIPYNSKYVGKGYDIDLDVHGGITFNGKFQNKEVYGEREGHWLGFDTAHCFDMSVGDLLSEMHFKVNNIYRDMNYVQLECMKLVDQLIKEDSK